MQASRDITTHPEWLDEQIDRLIGFEVLHKALSADPTPIPPSLLADKIGCYKGFSHNVLTKIAQRHE